MKITQGAFSFLPELTDDQIVKQLAYCLSRGWSIGVEYTQDPHPRNALWEMFGAPMFDLADPAPVMKRLAECRVECPNSYIKIVANDASRGRETVALSFIVTRPALEPGFWLERQEGAGRAISYTIRSYAVTRPEGSRYDSAGL
ncbi:MAG: ribulose bisphosphate carboxylase small subunit [Acidobacteria bacterium]|nr:ribulose bisphosphate carboxylase small subunit [Acidobacteriota bacterium]